MTLLFRLSTQKKKIQEAPTFHNPLLMRCQYKTDLIGKTENIFLH